MRSNGRNRANKAQKGWRAPVKALPPQGLSAIPRSYTTGRPNMASAGTNLRLKNTEIALEIVGTAAAGVIPAGGAIRVIRFSNTAGPSVFLDQSRWIGRLATLFDKFTLHTLKLRYVPSLPVTWAGQVALRFDADTGKITPDASLLAVSGDMYAKATQVANAIENKVDLKQIDRLGQYETFAAPNDTGIATIGSINLAYSSLTAPSNTTTGAVTIGYVWMDYDVEFLNPSNVVTA